MYKCDSHFNTDILRDQLAAEAGEAYGYIIVDGHACVLAKVDGAGYKVLLKNEVDLPNKHRKGGQSATRFSRQRV